MADTAGRTRRYIERHYRDFGGQKDEKGHIIFPNGIQRAKPAGKVLITAHRHYKPRPQIGPSLPNQEIGTKGKLFEPTKPKGKLKLTNTKRRMPSLHRRPPPQ